MIRRRGLLLVLVLALISCRTARPAERVLYQKKSPYNTVVVTEDDQGLRTLCFERHGPRQSVVKVGDPDHLELPYVKAMLVGLALVEQPRRMLVVGLGGGSLPSILRKHYPEATIDVVDIDPDVVMVAKRFFGFREDAGMHAHVEDGRRFVERCRVPYDLIFLDAYGAEEIPYHLATQQCLGAVRRALAPNGLAVANVWGRRSNPLYDSMLRTYQDRFDQVYVLEVQGSDNKILLALPRQGPVDQADLARRARAISKDKALRFDLGELATCGFHRPEQPDSSAAILMDRGPTTSRPE